MTATDTTKIIPVTVAYAPTIGEQRYLNLSVAQGTTVEKILIMTGWLNEDDKLSEWFEANRHAVKVDRRTWRVGIFSQKVLLSQALQANDRVEVYRPLILDPMRQRQQRLNKQQSS